MTTAEAVALLVAGDVAVVSVEVPAAATGSNARTWYDNPPVEPIRVGRRKVWRVSDLRTFLGLEPNTADGS